MLTIDIVSKMIRHIILLISSLLSACNETTPPVAAIQTASISVPKIALGDTSRYVKLQIELSTSGAPRFSFTDLLFDKNKGLMLMKDDGIATDYTIVYQILNGGVVNGKRYPGFTYDDGTGKKIGYKYSFAVNTNDEHSTSANVTSWKQMMEMIDKGHTIMNHTLFHGGTDKLKAIKDAEKNMWIHTRYRMTELVPPGSDEGFVETGLQLGYQLISAEFGGLMPDGNNDPGNVNISWGSYIPMTTQNFKKALISRTNLGDRWNTEELENAKAFVDDIFTNKDLAKKPIGTAFSHGPFFDHKESANIFNQFMLYIKNHPENKETAWIASAKEIMDYVNTKAKVVVSSKKYDPKNKKYHIVFDMGAVNPNVIYRNLSLKLSGGKIANISATGANDVTFNTETGLINIYKTDRSKVKDPSADVLPPQITSLRAKQNYIFITYDKPVHQKNADGYEISGNKIISLTGDGKNWKLVMQAPVKLSQLFSYRMQQGQAVQEGVPSMRVCSYIDMPIKQ